MVFTYEKMCAVQLAKTAVRKNVSQILERMSSQECSLQSEKVYEKVRKEKLINTTEWKNAKRVSLYLSMDKEIQTDAIVKTALSEGKECFIPVCRKNRMRMLKLHGYEDFKSLPRNSWGIREPLPVSGRDDAVETGGVDLIVVPGVAFALSGDRIGHGKGYYDRFLKEIKQISTTVSPVLVGLAFRQQILEEVPMNDFDVPVDRVLCASDC